MEKVKSFVIHKQLVAEAWKRVDEHNPPHFHVKYNEYRASININTLNTLSGKIPAKVRGLVEEWAELHQSELLEMWESQDFHTIEPLV